MNIKIFLLIFLALSLFAVSCSRQKSVDMVDMEEIIMDDLSPEEREKILSRSSIDLRENKDWADNLARIEITRDNFGIKVEKQFYNNLPDLKYIAVHTFPNGSKQIFVYGQNGSVKSFSENVITQLLKSSPGELTKDIAVISGEENKASTGGMSIKTLPPITSQPQTVESSNPPPPQIQPTPVPAATIVEARAEKTPVETRPQEQPAAQPTPAEAVSPQNLKKNLQLYPSKRQS